MSDITGAGAGAEQRQPFTGLNRTAATAEAFQALASCLSDAGTGARPSSSPVTIHDDGSPSMFLSDAMSPTRWCPSWCVTAHDPDRGEDDWLHMSEPVVVAHGVVARLVMSIDPQTGEKDGPYVMVGDDQLTPEEARRRGFELSALAALAQRRQTPDAGA